MKKILLITNMYPSEKYPTYGIFVKKTYDWLGEKYDVDIVKMKKHNSKLIKLFTYFFFYFKGIILGVFKKYDCIYAHYISHCAFPVRIIKIFRKDIVVIGNIHGEDVFSSFDKFKNNPSKARMFLKYSDKIIAPSEYYKKKLNAEYDYPMKDIFVSPSGGVDCKAFFPDDKKACCEKLSIPYDTFNIGFVSRIVEGKGWETLLNAVNAIKYKLDKEYKVIIVGYGDQEQSLQEHIKKFSLSDNVLWIRMVDHELLHYYYNAFDVFCFTSERSESESLGLVGLEAFASGTPTIISNIDGPKTYATKDNCLFYKVNDYNDLGEKILQIMRMDKEEKKCMIKNQLDTARKFSSDKAQQEFISFFNDNIN